MAKRLLYVSFLLVSAIYFVCGMLKHSFLPFYKVAVCSTRFDCDGGNIQYRLAVCCKGQHCAETDGPSALGTWAPFELHWLETLYYYYQV